MNNTFDPELEDIKDITNSFENSCKCKDCAALCKRSPCLGTPSDILKLVRAGFSGEIAVTQWRNGVQMGIGPINMIQVLYNPHEQRCIFLDDKDLCKLHDLGLKPTEGRLTTCKTINEPQIGLSIPAAVALTWKEPENEEVVLQILNELKLEQERKQANEPG